MMGYNCTENCGYKHECDVDESGERICPECGVAVTGITGHISNPNSTAYDVVYGTGGISDGSVRVNASSPEDAFNRAQPEVPDGKIIVEISN